MSAPSGDRRCPLEERGPARHGAGRALIGAMGIARVMVMLRVGAGPGRIAGGTEGEPWSLRGRGHLRTLVERRQDDRLEQIEGKERNPGRMLHRRGVSPVAGGRSSRLSGLQIGQQKKMGPPHRAMAPGIRTDRRPPGAFRQRNGVLDDTAKEVCPPGTKGKSGKCEGCMKEEARLSGCTSCGPLLHPGSLRLRVPEASRTWPAFPPRCKWERALAQLGEIAHRSAGNSGSGTRMRLHGRIDGTRPRGTRGGPDPDRQPPHLT
jgi:hypothetical protein